MQWGGFIGRRCGPFIKTGVPVMKNALKSLDERACIPSGLVAAVSAANGCIHKKILVQKLCFINERCYTNNWK